MADTPNHEFPEYLITLQQTYDAGLMDNFPDPSPPDDLDTELTKAEKNFVKFLYKEVTERFKVPDPSPNKQS